VAAAPRLVDDSLFASPELALVDVDLAARLREGICTGDEFRPRSVARPEYRYLHPVVVSLDASPHPPSVDEPAVMHDAIVTSEDATADVGGAVVLELAAPPTDDSDLPDYVLRTGDPDVDDAVPDVDASAPVEPVIHEYPALPDFGEVLPDYVVAPEETSAADVGDTLAVEVALDPPAPDTPELPDFIVRADDLAVETIVAEVDASAKHEPANPDYPVLPDLGEASDALEETDAALRKIREQMASEEPPGKRRRLRRGFTVASGLGAIAALAVLGLDVQQGFATLPGWLSF
jgi:hypothetical protein